MKPSTPQLARPLAQRARTPARTPPISTGDSLKPRAGQQRLEPRAPLALRQRSRMSCAVLLQQVVGHEGDRRIGQHLLRQRLAADALLQQRERRGTARERASPSSAPRSRPGSRHRARCRRAAAAPAPRSRESARSPAPRRATRSRPGPPRLTTWPRMPSYFHSTCQSLDRAEPRGEQLRRDRRAGARGRRDRAGLRRRAPARPPRPARPARRSARPRASPCRRCSPSCAAPRAWHRRRRARPARAAPAACSRRRESRRPPAW